MLYYNKNNITLLLYLRSYLITLTDKRADRMQCLVYSVQSSFSGSSIKVEKWNWPKFGVYVEDGLTTLEKFFCRDINSRISQLEMIN